MSTVIQCPHCQTRMRVTRSATAGQYRCIKCHQMFRGGAVANRSPDSPHPPSPEPARQAPVRRAAVSPPPLAQQAFCPHCQVEVTLPPDLELHEAACPECRHPLASRESKRTASGPAVTGSPIPLSRLNAWWVFVLGAWSSGAYYLAWFYHNADALERSRSPRRFPRELIKIMLIISLIWAVTFLFLSAVEYLTLRYAEGYYQAKFSDDTDPLLKAIAGEDSDPQKDMAPVFVFLDVLREVRAYIGFIVLIIYAVILTLLAFRTRAILQDHYRKALEQNGISAFLTFLLNCVYLQYKINELEKALAGSGRR